MTKTYIIAEAGVNHNGCFDRAKELILAAKEAGVDAVKFQTFKPENVISKHAVKADYQIKNTGDGVESQLDMIKKLEINFANQSILRDFATEIGIEFLSAAFDLESIEFLSGLNLSRLKIPSGEITNAPYLLAASKTKIPLILSTGMASLEEIKLALGVISFGLFYEDEIPTKDSFPSAYEEVKSMDLLKGKVSILHCTTEYPCPFNEVNLNVLSTLKEELGLEVGYSDHTLGIEVPISAVAIGATIIEKHFTLDKDLPGPDHKASLDPIELKDMVIGIRNIEEAMGRCEKIPTNSEIKNMPIARKSLIALKPIKKGELFTLENLTTKRPGDGISPMRYWEFLGMESTKDFSTDELITEN